MVPKLLVVVGAFKLTKSTQEDDNQVTQLSFVEAVEDKVKSTWPNCKSGDEKWAAIRTAFMESGRTCKKRNPGNVKAPLPLLLFTETSYIVNGFPCKNKQIQGSKEQLAHKISLNAYITTKFEYMPLLYEQIYNTISGI